MNFLLIHVTKCYHFGLVFGSQRSIQPPSLLPCIPHSEVAPFGQHTALKGLHTQRPDSLSFHTERLALLVVPVSQQLLINSLQLSSQSQVSVEEYQVFWSALALFGKCANSVKQTSGAKPSWLDKSRTESCKCLSVELVWIERVIPFAISVSRIGWSADEATA